MQNNILISIIIPVYNRASLILETVDSILAQTYKHWECVIVDDGSTDNTIEVLQAIATKDSRFKIYQRPNHLTKGPNSCRNYGFEKSSGAIINWFDSDDLYQPNALEEVISKYDISKIDAVVVKVERFNFKTGETVDFNKIISNNLIEDYLVGDVTFYVCGPFWKRTFIAQQQELFDPKIRNLDDWDFNLRMLYQKPKIEYLNTALIRYRKSHMSLSKALGENNIEEINSAFYAREKHVKILETSNKTALKPFNNFIIHRYKEHLKGLLYANEKSSKKILKQLILKQLELFRILDAIKTITITSFYLLFKKGYVLLKKYKL